MFINNNIIYVIFQLFIINNYMINRNYTFGRSFVVFNSIPNSIYYLQKYNIPGFTIGAATQSTAYQDIPLPGDKISYSPFNATFILDEEMDVFLEIWNWIKTNNTENTTGDFTLYIYNNVAKKYIMKIDFIGGWVSQMNETLLVDSTSSDDTTPRLLDCLFNYAEYKPSKINGETAEIIIGKN